MCENCTVVVKIIPGLNVCWRIYWWNGMVPSCACQVGWVGPRLVPCFRTPCVFILGHAGGQRCTSPGGSQGYAGQDTLAACAPPPLLVKVPLSQTSHVMRPGVGGAGGPSCFGATHMHRQRRAVGTAAPTAVASEERRRCETTLGWTGDTAHLHTLGNMLCC